MSTIDPFDVLVALRPEADRSPVEPGTDPRIDALFRRTLDAAQAPAPEGHLRRTLRRWRRRIVGGGLVIGFVGGSAVAAAVLLRDVTPADPTRIACRSDETAVGVALETGVSPIETCRVLWSDGRLETSGAPTLQLCADTPGSYVVLPGETDQACIAEGLEPIDEFDPTAASALAVTVRELDQRLLTPLAARCSTEQETIDLIDSVLALEQFDGWTRGTGLPFVRGCGQAFIDASTKTVTVGSYQLPPNSTRPTGPSDG